MYLDKQSDRDKAYSAALAYLTNTKYRFNERYPWNTFVSTLESDVDMKATIDNTYLVEGLDGTPDYFGVIITLKYGPKPAALQVSLPQFEPLRCDVVPLPADRKTIASVIDITRLSSLPPGPVHIKFRIKDVPETGGYGPPPDPDYDFVYDPRDDNVPEPTLVWKPCRQSFSPFIPFYKFDVNNQFPNLAVKHFYLRADFRVEANTQTVNMTGFVEFDTSSLGF